MLVSQVNQVDKAHRVTKVVLAIMVLAITVQLQELRPDIKILKKHLQLENLNIHKTF
jgi:hypothetical protein